MKDKIGIAGTAGLFTSHVPFDDAESKGVQAESSQAAPEYKFQTQLDNLPARPASSKSSNTTHAYVHASPPHSVPIAGASTAAVTHQQATQLKGTDELYGLGNLPSSGPGRWEYLANPENWHPERRKLHEKLLEEARSSALTLAESLERDGCQPTLFALRGNTATGKTRIATKKFQLSPQLWRRQVGKVASIQMYSRVRLRSRRPAPRYLARRKFITNHVFLLTILKTGFALKGRAAVQSLALLSTSAWQGRTKSTAI